MKVLFLHILLYCLMWLGAKAFLYGQTDQPRILLKIDAFGISASLPNPEYFKFSPEVELKPGAWKSVSLTADLEAYRGIIHVHNMKLLQIYGITEFYYGKDYRTEYSGRIGLRKYLNTSNASGFFAEVQAGVSWNKRDSIYDLVDQFGEYTSQSFLPEGRIRLGYQNSFSKRFWYCFSLEGDIRRAVTIEKWYRVFVPEFNLGIGF